MASPLFWGVGGGVEEFGFTFNVAYAGSFNAGVLAALIYYMLWDILT